MNLKINGIYKHFKGNYYLVENTAIDCETGTEVVIYRALYGDNKLYIRNKKEFLSLVDKNKYPNVKQKFRFKNVKIKDIKN